MNEQKNAAVGLFIEKLLATIQGAVLVAIEAGQTIEGIAEEMGKTPQQLEDIIYGRTDIDLRTLSDLRLALGCDISFKLVPIDSDENNDLINFK